LPTSVVPITIFVPTPSYGIAGLNLKPVVAAGRHLNKLFEGWIVATPHRRQFAVRITSYPALDISSRSNGTPPRPRLPSGCERRWTTDAGRWLASTPTSLRHDVRP
jgi:hypothetical protein